MPFENVGPSLVPPYDGKLLCIVSLFPGGPKELSKINGGRAADEDEKKIASFLKKNLITKCILLFSISHGGDGKQTKFMPV